MKWISCIYLLFCALPFKAQTNDFYIKYELNVETESPAFNALAAGAEIQMAFNQHFFKCMSTVPTASVTIVADHKKKAAIVLMDMFTRKMSFEADEAQFDKLADAAEKVKNYPIKFTDETRSIAGWEARKVLIKDIESNTNIILFVSKALKPMLHASALDILDHLGGFPIYIAAKNDKGTMKLSAKEIHTKVPPVSVFSLSIPTAYPPINLKELEELSNQQLKKN